MERSLCYYGNPILRQKANKIEKITPEIRQLAADLIDTMIVHHGVGLAAPQIGVALRMYVFRDEKTQPDGMVVLGEPHVVINPVLSSPSKHTDSVLEGCLSIPGIRVHVTRPTSIQICYQTLEDKKIDCRLEGFLARVNMHENDHLNGTLHVDRIDSEDRKYVARLLHKFKK